MALLSASEPAFRALKLVGAAYLIYLGAQSLLSAISGRGHIGNAIGRGAPLTPARALRQGMVSNLGNPKMAVFFASLLPQFVPAGSDSFAALLALGLVFCSLTLAWLALYALAVARLGQLLAGPARRVVDALTGIVLIALGVRLAGENR